MPFHKKKSKVNVVRIEKDIRALLEQRKSSQEIMDILSIPERTFRRYCSRIHQEDQNTWLSITKHQLATSLLKLRSSLEETYDISREMALDPKCEDRLGALASMNDARLSICQLLMDVDMIRKVQPQPKLGEGGVTNDSEESTESGTASTFKRIH